MLTRLARRLLSEVFGKVLSTLLLQAGGQFGGLKQLMYIKALCGAGFASAKKSSLPLEIRCSKQTFKFKPPLVSTQHNL